MSVLSVSVSISALGCANKLVMSVIPLVTRALCTVVVASFDITVSTMCLKCASIVLVPGDSELSLDDDDEEEDDDDGELSPPSSELDESLTLSVGATTTTRCPRVPNSKTLGPWNVASGSDVSSPADARSTLDSSTPPVPGVGVTPAQLGPLVCSARPAPKSSLLLAVDCDCVAWVCARPLLVRPLPGTGEFGSAAVSGSEFPCPGDDENRPRPAVAPDRPLPGDDWDLPRPDGGCD